MRSKQTGFTLIELVMVIVILGILAAFALPKFADLTGDARRASISGLAGSLKSASAIARAEQLVSGGGLGTTVNLDGQNVLMVNGYPRASAGGVGAAASVTSTDYTTVGGSNSGGGTVTFRVAGFTAATGTFCEVVYTAATTASDNVAPITASPTVVASTGGC